MSCKPRLVNNSPLTVKLEPDYSALIHADLDPHLPTIKNVIGEAYEAVRHKTDISIDPDFASPNRSSLQGFLRWGFVDTFLARACAAGLLPGISAHWLPTRDSAGAIEVLELRGQHTAVTAHHLHFIQDAPRQSRLRLEWRVLNQQNPLLPCFDPSSSTPDFGDDEEDSLFNWKAKRNQTLINVMLVHGAKEAEFAYLRVYDSVNDASSYIPVSGNIMAVPSILAAPDAENVEEPSVALKPSGSAQSKVQDS